MICFMTSFYFFNFNCCEVPVANSSSTKHSNMFIVKKIICLLYYIFRLQLAKLGFSDLESQIVIFSKAQFVIFALFVCVG